MKSESIGAIAKALSEAQVEMKKALMSADNPAFRSKYADLPSCLEAVLPALTKHGISLTQLPFDRENGAVGLETILMHTSGEWISCGSSMMPTKPGPHAVGSCLTYLRRYQLAAITGLSQADDDGNSAQAGVKEVDTAQVEKILEAAAKQGMTALKAAWESTDKEARASIVNGKAAFWERTKNAAADVDAAKDAA
jgi:hypothetical protein